MHGDKWASNDVPFNQWSTMYISTDHDLEQWSTSVDSMEHTFGQFNRLSHGRCWSIGLGLGPDSRVTLKGYLGRKDKIR